MKKLGREVLQNKSRIKGKEIKIKIVNHGGMMSGIYIYIYILCKSIPISNSQMAVLQIVVKRGTSTK